MAVLHPGAAWYVAAFANEVGEELLARTFLNEPVVLFRKKNGEAVAIGGRCPHRQFPLGKSCRKGDEIQCGYHGITFGPDGRCTSIPAQQAIPQAYRVPSYPLVEHGMWLFIWMGDPEKADRALLPKLDEIWYRTNGMSSRPFFFYEVKCRYQLLNDNLSDLTHLGFLHGTSIGNLADVQTPEELSKRPGFISSRRFMRNVEPPPALATSGRGDIARVDRISGMDFYLPGFHAGIGDFTYPQDHPEHPGQLIIGGRVYHSVTPSTHGTTYYFFGMSAQSEAELDMFEPFNKAVIAEDIFASEEIEKMLQLVGGNPKELMIKTDAGAVEGRRMLQSMMDSERRQASSP